MNQWIEGIHYYYNDKGLVVLTEAFHRQRGYCCGNGCLHCPFDFSFVPEPRKTKLLQARKDARGNTDQVNQ